MADQSPLGGLPPRSPRGAGPSRPRTELQDWEKGIRQTVHDMAHKLFNLTSPILDELDESDQRNVVKVLGKMLNRVGGNSAAGGPDDFALHMQRIQDQVGSGPARRPSSRPTETALCLRRCVSW